MGLLAAVALASSLLLLLCIPFTPLVKENCINDRKEKGEGTILGGWDRRSHAPPLTPLSIRRPATLYPTQYITPDRTDRDYRNITLTVSALHGRAVHVLEWSSALEEEDEDEETESPSHRTSVLAIRGSLHSLSQSGSGRGPLERPSLLAKRFGCRYAVNAGPFRASGEPVGSVVSSAGSVRRFQPSTDFVGFGITKPQPNAPSSWVVGSVSTVDELESLRDFVTGFGWLVYGGKNVVVEPDDEERTGAMRAPRTAFGVTAHGSLVMVVADGCEKW